MKILIVGDIHFRRNTPTSRLDDIAKTIIDKFYQLKAIIEENDVQRVLCTADIFDSPRVNNETLLLAKSCIELLKVPFYTGIGNHDMIGNSVENHNKSSLYILHALCNNLHVNEDIKTNDNYYVHFNNYGNDEFNFSAPENKKLIIVTHSMITNKETMFDSIAAKDIESNADLIITGHNHNKFEEKAKTDTTVYNPGALLRLTAAEEDMNRDVEVGILDTDAMTIKKVLLDIAPVEEVFKLEEIEEKRQVLKKSIDEAIVTLEKFMDVKELTDTMLAKEKVGNKIKEIIYEYLKFN